MEDTRGHLVPDSPSGDRVTSWRQVLAGGWSFLARHRRHAFLGQKHQKLLVLVVTVVLASHGGPEIPTKWSCFSLVNFLMIKSWDLSSNRGERTFPQAPPNPASVRTKGVNMSHMSQQKCQKRAPDCILVGFNFPFFFEGEFTPQPWQPWQPTSMRVMQLARSTGCPD